MRVHPPLPSRSRRAALAIVVYAATGLAAPSAHAQDAAQESARRALIVEAEAASDRGDHVRALELATRAGALRMTPSLRLLIAQEHEALGAVLDALDGAERCAREAEVDPALRQRDALLEECRALITRTRAATATLRVSPARAEVEITVGDRLLAAALRDLDLPQMPGACAVRARSEGRVYFEQTVTLRAGERTVVEVPAPPPPPPPPPPPSPPPSPPPPVARAVASTRSPGPWLLVGAGAAGMIAGGVLWWRRDVAVGDCAISDAALLCPSAESVARAEGAAALGVLSQVTAAVGAASVVAGVLWRLTERPSVTSPRARVWPCVDERRVGLCGVF